jgi:hypothetical protein
MKLSLIFEKKANYSFANFIFCSFNINLTQSLGLHNNNKWDNKTPCQNW